MFDEEIKFIRNIFQTEGFIPLHEPFFDNREKEIMVECIESGFVSSVGKFVDEFEVKIAEFCGVKKAVACVNGTNALHLALLLSGIKTGDKVITQPLTFIATVNAIKYCGAEPIFVDVDSDTIGLSAEKLEDFLQKNYDKKIKAVLPMHTFGKPCRIDEIKKICDKYNLKLIEDCAESLGSFYKNSHTGNFGDVGVLSFNGNKIITTGGGGMLLFNDENLARRAKHLTTQAKISHKWEFAHDEIGFNYRMPNINAALGLAQLEKLPELLKKKRKLAKKYQDFFGEKFIPETKYSIQNHWLNAILLKDKAEQESFLQATNDSGIMTRPVWRLMNKLPMFKDCVHGDLSNAIWLEERLVNIPSGVKL
jgi:aminotransferase in exopolysaccharide biosynthesis